MGSKIALGEIQTAIYTRLTGDATLMGKVSGVYDYVPDTATAEFPYIQIGEMNAVAFNTFDKFGKDTSIDIVVYSQQEGFSEGYDIANRICELLDDHPLVVTGFHTALLLFDNVQGNRNTDGFRYEVALGFRLIVQES